MNDLTNVDIITGLLSIIRNRDYFNILVNRASDLKVLIQFKEPIDDNFLVQIYETIGNNQNLEYHGYKIKKIQLVFTINSISIKVNVKTITEVLGFFTNLIYTQQNITNNELREKFLNKYKSKFLYYNKNDEQDDSEYYNLFFKNRNKYNIISFGFILDKKNVNSLHIIRNYIENDIRNEKSSDTLSFKELLGLYGDIKDKEFEKYAIKSSYENKKRKLQDQDNTIESLTKNIEDLEQDLDTLSSLNYDESQNKKLKIGYGILLSSKSLLKKLKR